MSDNVFDLVARDYERIHNRSLPPGVSSDEFVAQKAAVLAEWICAGYRGRELRYLDFGCGNGRLFRNLLDSRVLQPILARGHLRLFGFDTSRASLREAEQIAGAGRVALADDFDRFPRDVRFDFVVSCNVFHHIPPPGRPAAVERLRNRTAPGARVVIWEHNPLNPVTRVLIDICPFDREARLLRMSAARRLFERSFRYREHAYVNVLPPRLHRFQPVRRLERMLRHVPTGTQYWVMFARDE